MGWASFAVYIVPPDMQKFAELAELGVLAWHDTTRPKAIIGINLCILMFPYGHQNNFFYITCIVREEPS